MRININMTDAQARAVLTALDMVLDHNEADHWPPSLGQGQTVRAAYRGRGAIQEALILSQCETAESLGA